MPSLLDPLPNEAVHLLRTVADGFTANDDNWPVWQYVMLRLDATGVNPEETLQNLPTWQYHYRPVSIEGSGLPEPDTRIALTVHGMYHADHPATNLLVRAFLTALGLAVERQRG